MDEIKKASTQSLKTKLVYLNHLNVCHIII
jgi:hypothetical protein